MDRNLAAVISARTIGTIALVVALVVPCAGFGLIFLGPFFISVHPNLILIVGSVTPLVLIPLALVLLNFPKRRRPPADQECRACGYDVRGQPSEGRCSECGTAI